MSSKRRLRLYQLGMLILICVCAGQSIFIWNSLLSHQELPSLDAENHIFPVFRVGSESERSALWSAVGEIELNEIGADGGRLVNTPLAHLIVAMAIAPVPGLGRRFREALRRRG